jgi:hypothetical protein
LLKPKKCAPYFRGNTQFPIYFFHNCQGSNASMRWISTYVFEGCNHLEDVEQHVDAERKLFAHRHRGPERFARLLADELAVQVRILTGLGLDVLGT